MEGTNELERLVYKENIEKVLVGQQICKASMSRTPVGSKSIAFSSTTLYVAKNCSW